MVCNCIYDDGAVKGNGNKREGVACSFPLLHVWGKPWIGAEWLLRESVSSTVKT